MEVSIKLTFEDKITIKKIFFEIDYASIVQVEESVKDKKTKKNFIKFKKKYPN